MRNLHLVRSNLSLSHHTKPLQGHDRYPTCRISATCTRERVLAWYTMVTLLEYPVACGVLLILLLSSYWSYITQHDIRSAKGDSHGSARPLRGMSHPRHMGLHSTGSVFVTPVDSSNCDAFFSQGDAPFKCILVTEETETPKWFISFAGEHHSICDFGEVRRVPLYSRTFPTHTHMHAFSHLSFCMRDKIHQKKLKQIHITLHILMKEEHMARMHKETCSYTKTSILHKRIKNSYKTDNGCIIRCHSFISMNGFVRTRCTNLHTCIHTSLPMS
jgi:hypothetical protein